MTKAGLHFYKLGLAKPTHDHGIPKDPPMPGELDAALAKNIRAHAAFATFPPSSKRAIYRWIESDRVHYSEGPNGSLLVCVKSLPITGDQSKEGK